MIFLLQIFKHKKCFEKSLISILHQPAAKMAVQAKLTSQETHILMAILLVKQIHKCCSVLLGFTNTNTQHVGPETVCLHVDMCVFSVFVCVCVA